MVAIGFGSKMPAKRSPLERFIELIQLMARRIDDLFFMLSGGPEERDDGEQITEILGDQGGINLAGAINIIESAEASSSCVLYIGNDAGTMHLASIMGTPCIALFSARQNQGFWEPFGEKNLVFRHDPECAGCMLTDCVESRMECLMRVCIEEVSGAVRKVLSEI